MAELAADARGAVMVEAGDHGSGESRGNASAGSAGAPAGTPRWFRPAALALTAVALALTVLGGLFGVQAWQGDREEARRHAALQAARQVALNLTTINHKTAEGDLQRLLDSSTGQFRKEFSDRSQSFVDVVRQAKVVTTGNVVAAGVESMKADSVRALVAVHGEVENTAAKQGQPRDYRLRITVTRVDGRWLASNVEFVS